MQAFHLRTQQRTPRKTNWMLIVTVTVARQIPKYLLNLPSHATSQAPNPILSAQSLDVSSNFPFSTDQKWTISLLKVLNDMNAPDYAFASILTWARSAVAEQYSFYPKGGLSRNRNLAYFTEGLQNGKLLLPAVVRVPSPNNPDLTCDVIKKIYLILQVNFVRLRFWESASTRPWRPLVTGAGDFGNGG
jgi:hypothetical protein